MRPEKNVAAAVPASPCHSGEAGVGLLRLGQRAQRLGDGDVRRGDGLQRLLALGGEHARAAARMRPAGARRDPRAPRQSSGHRRPTARWRRAPAGRPPPRRAPALRRCRRGRARDRRRGRRRSPARAPARRTAKASSPRRVSGCFSSAITVGRREVARRRRRDDEIEERAGRRLGERAAGGVVDADAPASRRTATRRASRRSGETSAAVRPGVSAASRRMSAMVSASSCADGASMRLTPASAPADGARVGAWRCTAASGPSCPTGAWPRRRALARRCRPR